jgi:hypothetical protein
MPRPLRNGGDQTTADIDERVAAGVIKKVRQRLQPDAVLSLEVVSHFRIGDLSQRHQLVGGSTCWAGLQIVGVQKLAHNRDTIEFQSRVWRRLGAVGGRYQFCECAPCVSHLSKTEEFAMRNPLFSAT